MAGAAMGKGLGAAVGACSTLGAENKGCVAGFVAVVFRGDLIDGNIVGSFHADHVRASELVADAVFSAGLRRFDAEGEAWKPSWVCYYFINDHAAPSFVVNVTDQYETKRRALACHASQFAPRGSDAVATRLTSSRFNQLIESRDALFGAQIGVAFAEGFVVRQPVERADLIPG